MFPALRPRRLWHETKDGQVTIEQGDLIGRNAPVVVLGEAGMGKTELLRWVAAEAGLKFITARNLQNSRRDRHEVMGAASTIVVDALDELSARGTGDAVDTVLRRLGDLDYPNFILSCRAADWRSATNVAAICGQYEGEGLLVLHLEPLTNADIREMLGARLAGGAERAGEVIMHFRDANLDGLLSNPQTLEMVATVAQEGPLPDSRAELFGRAMAVLQKEHRDDRSDLQLDGETALDAAGAAFAQLILTGSDAIVLQKADPDGDEIPLAEAAAFPGADQLEMVLRSRLFATAGAAGRFSYWQRSIGEYLGSRWLTRQATTVLKRRRLLALFHSHGDVPASLRGLHAWFAHHDPKLAAAVIGADPMAVIEYGEADVLDVDQAKHLLAALQDLSRRNPHFRRGWQRHSLKGLAQPALLEPIRDLLNDATCEPELRRLLLDALKGSSIADALRLELRRIVGEATEPLYHRLAAADALVELGGEIWADTVADLSGRKSANDVQLAAEIIAAVGADPFSDAEILAVAIAYAQHERLSGYVLGRIADAFPDQRLDGILDEMTAQIAATGKRDERRGNNELTDLGYRIIDRRLRLGSIDATRFWSWLRPFDEQYGYGRDERKKVHAFIAGDEVLRRAMQRLVLLDEPGSKTVWERQWRLTSRSPGLQPTPEDVLTLLGLLDCTDERWRDLITLTPHSETEGVEVRDAARRFVANRPDMLAWIDSLAHPKKHDWQIQQEREHRRREAKRAMEWQEHRRSYHDHIDAMRQGQANVLYRPALAYMGARPDLDDKAEPRGRLVTWLGDDLAHASLEGFEAFLKSDQPPSASQVADNHGRSKSTPILWIVVAALVERVRCGKTIEDVNDDLLTVAFYELQHTQPNDPGRTSGLWDLVSAQMEVRGLKQDALRAWIEPQLKHGRSHVDQLYLLMRDAPDGRAADLALSWLSQYPNMPIDPEKDMIGQLVASRRLNDLRELADRRLSAALPDDRTRLWNAVAYVADFEAQRDRLEKVVEADPTLIWAIRRRIGGYHGHDISRILGVDQLVWLVQTFRGLFRYVEHLSGVVSGDEMPWDAAQFLISVASRLADMTTDEAAAGSLALVQAPVDTYTKIFRSLMAEQQRKSTEERYRPPLLNDLRRIVDEQPPRTVADLQASVLGLLDLVQRRITADPADAWHGFYTDAGEPRGEERCRDHLLILLGIYPEQIDLQPEGHMAQDKRADIIGQIAGLRLPVEIKGQWHPKLWQAADTQLDRLYTSDYAAERRGIYLVLWFGDQVPPSKKLRTQGRGTTSPATPKELRERLVAVSQAAREGRVEIVVLDCTIPPSS